MNCDTPSPLCLLPVRADLERFDLSVIALTHRALSRDLEAPGF